MSEVQFDSPAKRIIREFEPKDKFGIQLLPDLAFLRQLSIQGRLRYFQVDGSEPTLTITPNVGETLFIYRISYSTTALIGTFTTSNDGNTREILVLGINTGNGTLTTSLFDSLVGDGIKSFTITESGAGSTRISVFGWVENTSRIRDVTA